jgi:hypothetical protein
VIRTVASAELNWPKFSTYRNCTSPVKLVGGVYVKDPLALMLRVPGTDVGTRTTVTLVVDPRLSLATTPLAAFTESVVFRTMAYVSATGLGGASTFTVTVAVSWFPFPSVIVYVNVSVPENPRSGV